MPSLRVLPSDPVPATGPYRSLEEHAGMTGQRERLSPVQPGDAIPEAFSRRSFLTLLGGGIGLSAALDGCFKPPAGQILPYAKIPVNAVPGEPLHYATALPLDDTASSLLVTCYQGRPTKVEGNPDHPDNLGTTWIYEQATIAQLYDENRAREMREGNTPKGFHSLQTAFADLDKRLTADGGAGLRFLVAPTASPFVEELWRRLLTKYPKARLVRFSPTQGSDGTPMAFGRPLVPVLDLAKADVVVTLDGDFLGGPPFGLRESREFAARRLPAGQGMNRLYAAECNLSLTGMMADHRLRVKSADVGGLALALLREVEKLRPSGAPQGVLGAVNGYGGFASGKDGAFVHAAAKDLVRAAGRSLVIVGPRQPAEVQALGHALNGVLGNIGQTISYRTPASGPAVSELKDLVAEIDAGKVQALVVTANNPVFNAPSDLAVGTRLAKVPFSVYLSEYEDETSAVANWFVPRAHAFESWSDARTVDGSVAICQPLLAPLFGGQSEAALLLALLGDATPSHDALHDFWKSKSTQIDFAPFWEASLRRGTIAPPSAVAPSDQKPALVWSALAQAVVPAAGKAGSGLELNFYTDATVFDGRFARNAWLLELPDPVSKLTWGNAVFLSPKTGADLGIATEDIVEVASGGQSVQLPAYLMPGHADGAISVHLGYGQRNPSRQGTVGTNVYPLRTSAAPWFATGAALKKTGATKVLALTQEHWTMDGRDLALQAPLASFDSALKAGEPLVHSEAEEQPTLYTPFEYKGNKWAMAIDLSRCTGCSACVVACQSENNTPTVGETDVLKGREMHWLRLDRYFSGDPAEPEAITQPVACVHCENAPCEYVCPVNATVHSDEGLNEMVYNRCVGTRYCSNNCPYKVRRFNWFNYAHEFERSEVDYMRANPEVTVRARGVMEKCTYCVQRIERGRIKSRVEGRELRDGEIRSACQQVCPTQAITFGTLSDAASQVSRLHRDPRAYHVLRELGTRPRTAHLVRLKNKNPELS
jgi:molybdopterin-containing oxidoreductase family iron-sulfur binding subunit